MTDNERLAKWQEWEEYHSDMNKHVPDYLNDDAAAMSLLDTLVAKGHEPKLQYYHNIKQWGMMPDEDCGYEWLDGTRREAVVAACLEVARKEDV